MKLSLTSIMITFMVFCILSVSVIPVVAWSFHYHVKTSAQDYIFEDLDDIANQNIAIVPGARVYADGTPSPALEDRLRCALDLYGEDKVQRILVSGDHGQRKYDEVNAMHTWLIARGVLVDDVFLDHAGFRTFDTMERAKKIFLVEEAVICTQRFHLDRAVFLARRSGIDAIGLVADRRIYSAAGADRRRESLATTRAVFDSYLPFTSPRFLGDPIPIHGDSMATHDSRTVQP